MRQDSSKDPADLASVLDHDRLTCNHPIIHAVEIRFVSLATATLSFPAQLWIQGLRAAKVWYAKCLSMMRAVKPQKLNQGVLFSEGTKIMEWTAPKFEEVALNCEINSYASAAL